MHTCMRTHTHSHTHIVCVCVCVYVRNYHMKCMCSEMEVGERSSVTEVLLFLSSSAAQSRTAEYVEALMTQLMIMTEKVNDQYKINFC